MKLGQKLLRQSLRIRIPTRSSPRSLPKPKKKASYLPTKPTATTTTTTTYCSPKPQLIFKLSASCIVFLVSSSSMLDFCVYVPFHYLASVWLLRKQRKIEETTLFFCVLQFFPLITSFHLEQDTWLYQVEQSQMIMNLRFRSSNFFFFSYNFSFHTGLLKILLVNFQFI